MAYSIELDYASRIDAALEAAFELAGTDGEHHKAYCIDQMVRALLKDRYEEWVTRYETDEETGERDYEWDAGIAP